jgi:hypothetical protein
MDRDLVTMEFDLAGELFEWRGPSPYHFIRVPEEVADAIREVANLVTYGWGVIPVTVRIGASTFTTALFPRDGGYLVPIKDRVRRAEGLALGDLVSLELAIGS